MSGRNGVVALRARLCEQQPEFQMAVAVDTRIGCQSARIAVGKTLNDLRLKRFGEIKCIKRNAQLFTDAAGICDVICGGGCIQLHRRSADGITRLEQQSGRDRTVHTAGHCRENAIVVHVVSSCLSSIIESAAGSVKSAHPA